jgi:CheY-like chemotaxis protein
MKGKTTELQAGARKDIGTTDTTSAAIETWTPGRPKRVLVVDQFPGCRLAMGQWLEQTPDLKVCGEANRYGTALWAVGHLKPDVMVTEILSQQDFAFIRRIRRRHPGMPILVFSFRDEECYAPRALEAGADGFVRKAAGVAGLLHGIRGVLEGRIVLSTHMRTMLLSKCLGGRGGLRRHGRKAPMATVRAAGTGHDCSARFSRTYPQSCAGAARHRAGAMCCDIGGGMLSI